VCAIAVILAAPLPCSSVIQTTSTFFFYATVYLQCTHTHTHIMSILASSGGEAYATTTRARQVRARQKDARRPWPQNSTDSQRSAYLRPVRRLTRWLRYMPSLSRRPAPNLRLVPRQPAQNSEKPKNDFFCDIRYAQISISVLICLIL